MNEGSRCIRTSYPVWVRKSGMRCRYGNDTSSEREVRRTDSRILQNMRTAGLRRRWRTARQQEIDALLPMRRDCRCAPSLCYVPALRPGPLFWDNLERTRGYGQMRIEDQLWLADQIGVDVVLYGSQQDDQTYNRRSAQTRRLWVIREHLAKGHPNKAWHSGFAVT
ncbi:hypothetical protein HYPSUDRAFT_200253 [Hypholoma sublateritium FD-334 SS-4]|uniref:Uncharacterized protein n=1 Tax=Hypholoma sublateritium (strain FD-334 SS-4) TaxID=945553 RepID=A0A0D2P7U4_HYPSF|nr:hypothetical protein HYPSUDRAFT_200253 [Hypholoma sublateritium FD-334 SS-4]